MQNKSYRRPLIPLTAAFSAGITAGSYNNSLATATIIVSLTSLISVAAGAIWKKCLTALPLILFFSTGFLFIQPYTGDNISGNHISRLPSDRVYLITGVITKRPVEKRNRLQVILNTSSAEDDRGKRINTTGLLRLNIYGDLKNLSQGDILTFSGRLKRFRNFSNPGGFDYVKHMALKGIHVSSYTGAAKVKVKKAAPELFVPSVQKSVISLIDKSISSTDISGVLKALIIGDKQWISREISEAFSASGTRHLLAISGLHIGIVSGCGFFIFCITGAFIPAMVRSGRVFSTAGILALVPALFYGFIAGMSPSTQRALLMAAVLLLTFSLRVEHDLLNTLAAAALIILIVSPKAIFSISFQLSFTAVSTIIQGGPLIKKLQDKKNEVSIRNLLFYPVSYFIISLLAFVGTMPLVLFYFNEISLVGVCVNIVMVPIIGFFVVPPALSAVMIYPFSLFFSSLIMKISGFFLGAGLSLIRFSADLPFSSLKTVTPSLTIVVCSYALLFLLIRRIVSGKKDKGILTASAIIFIIILTDTAFHISERYFNRDMRVTFLDVGQGSSAFIELPKGKNILIDGGGFSDNNAFDIGEKIIAPYLWKKKIVKVDTIILTHPESDHLNGLLYILENFNVKRVWSNHQPGKTAGYKRFLKIIAEKKIEHAKLFEIFDGEKINGARISILYPPEDFKNRIAMERWRNCNNNSLVIKITFKDLSFLFTGDIMEEAEKELVKIAGDSLRSRVLAVAHHGSISSSTEVFLNHVKPEYAVISAGWKNRYKMPHELVLKKFNKKGVRILRTDLNGSITMSVSEKGLIVRSFISDNSIPELN